MRQSSKKSLTSHRTKVTTKLCIQSLRNCASLIFCQYHDAFVSYPISVSRLHCESESFKMDMILDVNTWIYPMELGMLMLCSVGGCFPDK